MGAVMKIALVVGARPNFVKAAAILHAAEKFPQIEFDLIHTWQHTDIMSDPYFRDLRLPEPDGLADWRWFGSEKEYHYTNADRLGMMVGSLGDEFMIRKPDAVMVVGDTDSTLAGALAAVKCGLPVYHVEAGLRCGNMKMQEEMNRIMVDSVATRHYCTTTDAAINVAREGRCTTRTVGNVMVDTLYRFLPEALARYPKRASSYALLTLHRAELVDNYEKYERVIDAVAQISAEVPVIWPRHPRCPVLAVTLPESIIITEPMGYLEFISAVANAEFVMTDSGGVQEETTALGVKCITLRDDTERPETIWRGTNVIAGTNPQTIIDAVHVFRQSTCVQFLKPDLWDGRAGERIMEDLCEML
jgi:UDP-N-acetylglucosamine 2-epimerase (non-hydrolysing)